MEHLPSALGLKTTGTLLKMRRNQYSLATAGLLSLTAFGINSLQAAPPSDDYQLIYEDHFQGAKLNTNAWAYRLGERSGAGMLNCLNRAENVTVANGLHIGVRPEKIEGKIWNTGGGVISRHQFGYGYYETLSTPFMASRGVHSSMWQAGGAVPNNSIFEIDGYEIDSKSAMACHNLYVHLSPAAYKETPWPMRCNQPLGLGQNGSYLCGYEFTPGGVNFYENGRLTATADWPQLTAQQVVWLSALNGVGKVDAVPGETTFSYFRYYAKDYPGVNLLPNGSFEYNLDKINPHTPVAWQVTGENPTAVLVKSGGAANGNYYLHLGSDQAAFDVTTSQKLEFVRNGSYELTALIRNSSDLSAARMTVSGCGGDEQSVEIPKSAEWQMIRLPKITVSNLTAVISITAKGNAGQWVEVDDVRFQKPPRTGVAPVPTPKFQPVGDPIWTLAKREPIRFGGDGKFYFFDRVVGFGDAISVEFTVNANRLANTTPIARMPPKGNSGWAVQLTEKGQVVFCLGSIERHQNVVAEAHYQPGKDCHIACLFDRGVAKIFVNGILLKTVKDIPFDTQDRSAPGRVGANDNRYDAVGEVIMPATRAKKITSTKGLQPKNFAGTMANIEIYNRTLSDAEAAGARAE